MSARDPMQELAEEEALVEEISEAQWARILDGRKFRILIKPEQQEWAGRRAVRCGNCAHTKMHGDPRRGWCVEHRCMVSHSYPVLCREHAPA